MFSRLTPAPRLTLLRACSPRHAGFVSALSALALLLTAGPASASSVSIKMHRPVVDPNVAATQAYTGEPLDYLINAAGVGAFGDLVARFPKAFFQDPNPLHCGYDDGFPPCDLGEGTLTDGGDAWLITWTFNTGGSGTFGVRVRIWSKAFIDPVTATVTATLGGDATGSLSIPLLAGSVVGNQLYGHGYYPKVVNGVPGIAVNFDFSAFNNGLGPVLHSSYYPEGTANYSGVLGLDLPTGATLLSIAQTAPLGAVYPSLPAGVPAVFDTTAIGSGSHLAIPSYLYPSFMQDNPVDHGPLYDTINGVGSFNYYAQTMRVLVWVPLDSIPLTGSYPVTLSGGFPGVGPASATVQVKRNTSISFEAHPSWGNHYEAIHCPDANPAVAPPRGDACVMDYGFSGQKSAVLIADGPIHAPEVTVQLDANEIFAGSSGVGAPYADQAGWVRTFSTDPSCGPATGTFSCPDTSNPYYGCGLDMSQVRCLRYTFASGGDNFDSEPFTTFGWNTRRGPGLVFPPGSYSTLTNPVTLTTDTLAAGSVTDPAVEYIERTASMSVYKGPTYLGAPGSVLSGDPVDFVVAASAGEGVYLYDTGWGRATFSQQNLTMTDDLGPDLIYLGYTVTAQPFVDPTDHSRGVVPVTCSLSGTVFTCVATGELLPDSGPATVLLHTRVRPGTAAGLKYNTLRAWTDPNGPNGAGILCTPSSPCRTQVPYNVTSIVGLELSKTTPALVQPGAPIVWTIAYAQNSAGLTDTHESYVYDFLNRDPITGAATAGAPLTFISASDSQTAQLQVTSNASPSMSLAQSEWKLASEIPAAQVTGVRWLVGNQGYVPINGPGSSGAMTLTAALPAGSAPGTSACNRAGLVATELNAVGTTPSCTSVAFPQPVTSFTAAITYGNICGASVTLDGSASQNASSFAWSEGRVSLGSGAILTVVLAPGDHSITLAASAPGAGTRSLTQTVTIAADTTKPVITCPQGPVEVPLGNDCLPRAPLPVSATDACAPAEITPVCPLLVGSSTTTCTATDPTGNFSTCSFTTHVTSPDDQIPPPGRFTILQNFETSSGGVCQSGNFVVEAIWTHGCAPRTGNASVTATYTDLASSVEHPLIASATTNGPYPYEPLLWASLLTTTFTPPAITPPGPVVLHFTVHQPDGTTNTSDIATSFDSCDCHSVVNTGLGTAMFEDLHPSKGDYDFNDQLLTYNYSVELSGAKATRMKAVVDFLAAGAVLHNGVFLRLPGISPSQIASVVRYHTGGAPPELLPGNGTVSGETQDAVIQVVRDTRTIFGSPSGFINTEPLLPVTPNQAVALVITFNGPVDYAAKLSGADAANPLPFDLFLARTGHYDRQIHLTNYGPTPLGTTDLRDTADDGSNRNGFGDYVTTSGVPFGLTYPSYPIAWPKERVPVSSVFKSLVPWIQSRGADQNLAAWYSDRAQIDFSSAWPHVDELVVHDPASVGPAFRSGGHCGQ